MNIEDRQGKRDVEQNTTRASENQKSTTSTGKSTADAAIKAQQQQTRDAMKRNLGK